MANDRYIKSSLECIQMAWGLRLRDFRQWCKPEGQAVYRWKTAPLEQAILACRSNMIDDSQAMLKAWEENQNSQSQNRSAFIPVMTTAIAPIQAPPEYDQVIGRSEWLDVVIPHDPENRVAQLRAIPSALRCQIAFFCPDVHGAMMISNQLCAYFRHESKRTFEVAFELGFVGDKKLIDNWEFRVLDNSLFPDTAGEYQNLTIVTVDCTIMGDIPIITGLDGAWDNYTDTGEVGTPDKWKDIPPNTDITPPKKPTDPFKPVNTGATVNDPFKAVTGEQTPNDDLNAVVIEADIYPDSKVNRRIKANKETKEITVENLPKDSTP